MTVPPFFPQSIPANCFVGRLGISAGPAEAIPISYVQALGNARLAITAAYTVLNADKGKTIALGGTGYFTLTFGSASAYDANFSVIVINESTTRAKLIALSGGATFLLWPLQSIIVFNQANVWQTLGRSRWRLPSATTLNVDPALGSDTLNDGLAAGSGGAFATLAKAEAITVAEFDFNGQAVTVSAAASQSYAPLTITQPWTGGGSKRYTGNTTTPSLCRISSASDNCIRISCTLPGSLTIEGFQLATSAGAAIKHEGVGTLSLGVMDFDTTLLYYSYAVNIGAKINFTSRCTWRGDAQYAFLADEQGQIRVANLPITILGNRTYSFFTASASKGALIECFGNAFVSVAIAGGGTGYAVGDTITLAGGTLVVLPDLTTRRAVLIVNAVSGGVITEAVMTVMGVYSALPTNPVAQFSTTPVGGGAGGTGATFTIGGSTLLNGSWNNPSTVTTPNGRVNFDWNGTIFVNNGQSNVIPGSIDPPPSPSPTGGIYA